MYCPIPAQPRSAFVALETSKLLRVVFAPGVEDAVPQEKRAALRGVLENDPRPRYQDDPARVYGMDFAGMNVKFRVENGVLTVESAEK